MMIRRATVAAALSLIAISGARAQCPDGSPPPCRAATIAAAPRRVNPPLDDRTWIVVPFDNVAKNQEIDWLRAGSVNLLYLGMSRWTDVRVIDDERVADYMREVPDAKSAESVSLNAGLAVAKRAGAGKLVMGDIIKLGSRTAVTAKIFDVKSGQRVRSVREETSVQDSVMPMYGKLAQKILNVAPTAGSNLGSVGTNSVAAFQEYVAGMQALNVFDLAKGRAHLERALQLDSTFALAHAKLSVLGGWENPGDPGNRAHAEAAARLSSTLPPRERALTAASVAFVRGEYPRACDGFAALVKNDSTDVEALYGLGDCLYHDLAMEAVNGDTTKIQFRADFNRSIRAFQKALEVDPTYHLAYQHIVDGYSQGIRAGRYCVETRCRTYLAILRPSGDSLIGIPATLPGDTAIFRREAEEYLRTNGRRRALDSALATANRWVAANPQESRARLMQATVLNFLGRVGEADTALTVARIGGEGSSTNLLGSRVVGDGNAATTAALLRVEIAVKLWRGADANRLYDSVRASRGVFAQIGNRVITAGNFIGISGAVFGRLTELDSAVADGIRLGGARGPSARLTLENPRTLVGIPSDSLAALERAAFDEFAPRSTAIATRVIGIPIAFALRAPRTSWPPLDSAATDPKARPAIAASRGDTAALRLAARRLDSLSGVYLRAMVPDTGMAIIAADAYLMLRDSASALRVTRRMLDSAIAFTSLTTAQSNQTLMGIMLPRAMLLRADLAAGLGFKDEARLWYKRLLEFWARPTPELQPLADRIRKSYAAVGGA